MGTYLIGDIHGCFDEFQRMLEMIQLSESDRLILIGDYIDRGPDSLSMLRWLERCPPNVTALRGNHEEEFIWYVDLLRTVDESHQLKTDPTSGLDASALYDTAKYLLKIGGMSTGLLDQYGTIGWLLNHKGACLNDLIAWANLMRNMPLFLRTTVRGKICVAVHAGYRADLEEEQAKEFYLYAREQAYRSPGVKNGIIVAGHTPTIVKSEITYNKGRVFRMENKDSGCVFYDIDCGCVFRRADRNARLACIRLEDEQILYV